MPAVACRLGQSRLLQLRKDVVDGTHFEAGLFRDLLGRHRPFHQGVGNGFTRIASGRLLQLLAARTLATVAKVKVNLCDARHLVEFIQHIAQGDLFHFQANGKCLWHSLGCSIC